MIDDPKIQTMKVCRRELLKMLLMYADSYSVGDLAGWVIATVNGKYLYILHGFTGLFYCVQCDRPHKKLEGYSKTFFAFDTSRDKIWVKNSIMSDLVPDKDIIENIDIPEYKEKYGMSMADFQDHLICLYAGRLN